MECSMAILLLLTQYQSRFPSAHLRFKASSVVGREEATLWEVDYLPLQLSVALHGQPGQERAPNNPDSRQHETGHLACNR